MNAKIFASNLRKECSHVLKSYPEFVQISNTVMAFDDEVEVGSWGFVVEALGERYGRFGPNRDNRYAVIHVTPNLDVVVSATSDFPEELLDCLRARATVTKLKR